VVALRRAARAALRLSAWPTSCSALHGRIGCHRPTCGASHRRIAVGRLRADRSTTSSCSCRAAYRATASSRLDTAVVVSYKNSVPYDAGGRGAVSWRNPRIGIAWPLHGEPKLSAQGTPRIPEDYFGRDRASVRPLPEVPIVGQAPGRSAARGARRRGEAGAAARRRARHGAHRYGGDVRRRRRGAAGRRGDPRTAARAALHRLEGAAVERDV